MGLGGAAALSTRSLAHACWLTRSREDERGRLAGFPRCLIWPRPLRNGCDPSSQLTRIVHTSK